jgi:hypothetical protein
MQVTFTRSGERRYDIAIERATGPRLAVRQGPGFDAYLPHDLVHFVVEEEAGLRGAVFGSLAAGESGIFRPVDGTLVRSQHRRDRKRKTPPAARRDMLRAEQLVSLAFPLWHQRAGHRAHLPDWFAQLSPEELGAPLIARICDRLDRVAPRWHALPVGGGITLTWPFPEGPRRPAPVRAAARDVPRGRRWANGVAARRG